MPQQQLSVITYSIIVSRMLYALPAWGDFISAELKNRINAFLSALGDLAISIVLLTLMISLTILIMICLKKFAPQLTPFIICFRRVA